MQELLNRKPVRLFIETFQGWQKDECLEMGASIAYYAVFSLFPIILVTLSIFGLVAGPDSNVYDQILTLAREGLPPAAYDTIEGTLQQMNRQSAGAGIIGFVTLLLAASGFFAALDRYFDKIWKVTKQSDQKSGMLATVLKVVWDKSFSFLLVLGCAALVLVAMLSNLVINILITILSQVTSSIGFLQLDRAWLFSNFQLLFSVLVIFMVLMVLFKFLPDTRVHWGDVWFGAVVTTLLMIVLQRLVSASIVNIGSSYSSYGVIGGVMVLMFWIYLTSQIFFLGGEMTYAYAHLYGSRSTAGPQEEVAPSPRPSGNSSS